MNVFDELVDSKEGMEEKSIGTKVKYLKFAYKSTYCFHKPV
jgi:hypothetical protein